MSETLLHLGKTETQDGQMLRSFGSDESTGGSLRMSVAIKSAGVALEDEPQRFAVGVRQSGVVEEIDGWADRVVPRALAERHG